MTRNPRQDVHIVALGAVTPVGGCWVSSAAGVRAGVSRLHTFSTRIDGRTCDGRRTMAGRGVRACRVRLRERSTDPTRFIAPATAWGNVGAATGGLLIQQAIAHGQRGMPGDTFEVIFKQTRWHTERSVLWNKRIKLDERVLHVTVDPVKQSFTAAGASGDPSIKLTYAQRTFTVKVTLLTNRWPHNHPHTDNDPWDTSEVEAWVRLVGNDGLFVPRKKTKSEPARYVYAPYHRYDREQRPSVNKEHWSLLP